MTKRSKKATLKSKVHDVEVDIQAEGEYQRNSKFVKKTIQFQPKTKNQHSLVNNIKASEVAVGIGPAGVGKTFCTATLAAQMILGHEVDRIVLTRANETVGKSIGMLPGTLEEKMTPLLLPILSVLKRQLGDAEYEYNMRKKRIEMLPLEYVRGLSFKDTFVIVDEAQNLTKDDVVALLTRYESGKLVLLGDPFQNDLKSQQTGIEWIKNFSEKHMLDIPVVEFGLEDIVRSDFVKQFLEALYSEQ